MGTTERTMQIKDSDWRKVATLVMMQNRMRDVVAAIEKARKALGIPAGANYLINEVEATITYTMMTPESVPAVPGGAGDGGAQAGCGSPAEGPENAPESVSEAGEGGGEDSPAVDTGEK